MTTTTSKITFKGESVDTVGTLPSVGSQAPEFFLTDTSLANKNLSDYTGKKVLMNIFPSIDTGVCAMSARKFNEEAASVDNAVILNISADLPFAHKRFCASEGIENAISLSDFRQHSFGENYGVRMTNGMLAGLFSRSVVVLDASGKVVYTEQVPEITQEPNYQGALNALKDA